MRRFLCDDALILVQYLAGRIALDPGQQARADLVADGGLDASDLTELLRRTVL